MSRRDLFDVEALAPRWSRARPNTAEAFDPDAHRGPPEPLAALPGAWAALEAAIRAELTPQASSAASALLLTLTPPSAGALGSPPDPAAVRALLAGLNTVEDVIDALEWSR